MYHLGIDLGGTKILIALIEKDSGKVVDFVKKKTKKDKGPDNIVRKMVEGIQELLEKTGARNDISSIGVGAAGQIDRYNGVIIAAPNLDCYDLNIKKILFEHFSIPVYVGNDVEIAAMGE